MIKNHWKIRIHLEPIYTDEYEFGAEMIDEFVPMYPNISPWVFIEARIKFLQKKYPNLSKVELLEDANSKRNETVYSSSKGWIPCDLSKGNEDKLVSASQ